MKKLIICFFTILLITGCSNNSNINDGDDLDSVDQSEASISMNLKLESLNLSEYITRNIGTEQPKLLYADKEKVIIEKAGILIYNIESKEITKTLDTWSFGNKLLEVLESSKLTLPGYFVGKDGKYIYFTYEYIQRAYKYDIQKDTLETISKVEFQKLKDEESYNIEYLEFGTELYNKSTGSLAYINETDYVYIPLTASWLIKDIKIAYNFGEDEVIYKLFDSKNKINYIEMMVSYDGSFSNSAIVDSEIDIKEYYVITNEDFNNYEEIKSILYYFFGGTGKDNGNMVEKLLSHIEIIVFNDFDSNSYFIINIEDNEDLKSKYSNELYLIHNNETSAFTLNDILKIIWDAKYSN